MHNPNNKECKYNGVICVCAGKHDPEIRCAYKPCTCPPEQKEEWENTTEWKELYDGIENIEWDSEDHYDGALFVVDTLKDFIRSQISLAESRAREEIKELLVEQIKVAIFAQEQHIKGLSQVGGFWETIQERAFKFDQLEGQKQILRFIEKGYFPALTEKV